MYSYYRNAIYRMSSKLLVSLKVLRQDYTEILEVTIKQFIFFQK